MISITAIRNVWSLLISMIVVLFLHTNKMALVTQTHTGIKEITIYYRLTCLIFPIAMEEVVYVYVSSEETKAQKS